MKKKKVKKKEISHLKEAKIKLLLEEKFEEIIIKTKKKTKKGFRKLIKNKGGSWTIRCQKKLKDGTQCKNGAVKGIHCQGHSGINKKTLERIAQKNKLAIYNRNEESLLKKELEDVAKISDEELLDIKKDVRVSEAIIQKLLNQQLGTVKIGDTVSSGITFKKIKDKSEANAFNELQRVRAIKSLQYSLLNNASLKKLFYDVKFADSNVVSKELFMYTFYKMNQIIEEEVKDREAIYKIAERVKKLGLELKERGMN